MTFVPFLKATEQTSQGAVHSKPVYSGYRPERESTGRSTRELPLRAHAYILL